MSFPIDPAEIDALAAKAERPIGYLMASAFRLEASVAGIPAERREALGLLTFVLNLSARLYSEHSARPFGKAGTNGSPEQLTKEQASDLAALVPHIGSPEIRALLADIAWLRIRGNPDLARGAVTDYLKSARALEDPQQWVECMSRAERAIRLGRSLGTEDPSFR